MHETDVTTPASDIVEADYDSCYPEVELVVDYCSCDMMDIDLTFSIKKRKSKKKMWFSLLEFNLLYTNWHE